MSNLISIGKVIDATWDHYVQYFKALSRIAMWLFVIAAFTVVGGIVTPVDAGESIAFGSISFQIILGIVLRFAGFIAGIIVGAWVFLAIIQTVSAQSRNKNVDQKAISSRSWHLIIPYFWVALVKFLVILSPLLFIIPGLAIIIYNTAITQISWISAIGILLTFIGVIAAFVGIVWFTVQFHFAAFQLVFDRLKDVGTSSSPYKALGKNAGKWIAFVFKTGVQSMKGAKELVKGRWWKSLWRIALPKVVFIVAIVFIQIILSIFVSILIPGFSGNVVLYTKISIIADTLISTGVAVLSTPLIILTDYYVYDSLRKTK